VSAPAVVADALSKRFGRATALHALDFELPAGRTLAVLGANGAGKSTLLRLLAGLSRPSSGRLEVAGGAPTDRGGRGRIGYVGHATQIYPQLTARENLLFAARLHALPDPGERADAALEREGLAEVAGRAAGDFSRGMAQRLAIARGLLHNPPLVLLDEPFTGLDRRSAERLGARLRALRDEHRTVVWVTHEPERVASTSDLALLLSRGRMLGLVEGDALRAEALVAALDADAAEGPA
jgi:heme exporter protein A